MKKRLLAIIATMALVVTMIPAMAFAATPDLVINNETDLKNFRDDVNSGNSYDGKVVQLASNVTITDANWVPIGNGNRDDAGYTGASFKGTFDGNNKKITGLKITSGTSALGLFGVIDGGMVKNLTLENVDIEATGSCTGGVVGRMVNNSTIDNVTVSGNIKGEKYVGGIAGSMTVEGTISNCKNDAEIEGSNYNIGGIVGAAYYTATDKEMNVINCVNNGDVSGLLAVGGIVGLSTSNVISCVNNGDVTGNGTSVGGVVGEQKCYGEVNDNTNTGDVVNNNNSAQAYGTGGIVGWVRYVGAGSTDYANYETIEVIGNTNSGSVTGGNDAGGIVGTVYNNAVVENNENRASELQGKTFAGGIVGNIQYPVGAAIGASVSIASDVIVDNNVSKTDISNINAACVDEYGYNNNPSNGSVTNNNDVWMAQIGDTKYATMTAALDAAKDGDVIEILDTDGQDEITFETDKNITILNKTGEDIVVNGDEVENYVEPEQPSAPEDGTTGGEAAEQPAPEEPAEDVEEAEDTVDTGDNMNMAIPFGIAGLALAAMAAVVATRRRTN